MSKPYTPNDRLSKKAKFQGFRARSVFKLKELDARFNLLKPGMKVLDIGAAPGSWLQYASEIVGSSGKVIGLDLEDIKSVAENVITKVIDITNADDLEKLFYEQNTLQFDLILSDIAPSTTGIKYVDQKRSVELNETVFNIAQNYLKRDGTGVLVMKILPGEDYVPFLKMLQRFFKKVINARSKASRDSSREIYVICR